jgi:hypothetical protein
MFEEKIEVIAYSGYRGEETPRIMNFRDKKIEIKEILKRWVEEGVGNRERKRFFQVKGKDGFEYKIYCSEGSMEWFYVHQD